MKVTSLLSGRIGNSIQWQTWSYFQYGCLLFFSHSVVSDPLSPMNGSVPGFPILHYLLEFVETHVHWVRCHPAISPSVAPFSSCPQSLPATWSFPMSWLFTSGGQSAGNFSINTSKEYSGLISWISREFPGLTSLISLQSKGLARAYLLQHYDSCQCMAKPTIIQ